MKEKIRTKESILVVLTGKRPQKKHQKFMEMLYKFWYFKIKKNNILAIKYKGNTVIKCIPGKNLVTNDGDLYYAKKAAGEVPIYSYVGIRLGSSSTPVTKTDTDVTTETSPVSRKLTDVGYPRTDDPDSANTEADVDVVTWRYSYTIEEGNTTGIVEGAIVDDIDDPTSALTHFLFSESFDKTDDQSMKIFVNHGFNGV